MSDVDTGQKRLLRENSTENKGSAVKPWHTLTPQQVRTELELNESSLNTGLSEVDARLRLAKFGPNRLREEKREPLWEVILEEIREPMILLLIFTGIIYSILGELSDGLTIFAVILIVVGIEIFNERRAEKAIAGLNKLAEPTAAVYRDGQVREVPVEEVVPGDVILLQEGRRVSADARLHEAFSLAVDESALTGEAMPVEKAAGVTLAENIPLAERYNLVFTGTLVTRGKATALVVATGPSTELGRVANLANQVKPPRTPLQLAMRELTGKLIWLALAFSLLVPLLSFFIAHQPLQQVILTGLSLAFATIPEELPILITMVLALGAYRLSRQKAIVKRLRAVETLGAVTVIATDKTGTLTENRMEVAQLYPEGAAYTIKLLEIGVVCNDASLKDGEFVGDPVDTALLQAARKAGSGVDSLRQVYPLVDEFTFDNSRKRMSVVLQREGRWWVAVKGAPEIVLTLCTHRFSVEGRAGEGQNQTSVNQSETPMTENERQSILKEVNRLAGEGQRVLAFAEKTVSIQANHLSQEEAESDLTFVGLVGLADPLRGEVKGAIADCHTAGIRTLMITGDHPLTAAAIAREAGILSDDQRANSNSTFLQVQVQVITGPQLDRLTEEELKELVSRVPVYARTTPEHKLKIVQALRARGELIAVTGDGINDAPALAAADIGVAMGESGTDVAREAADMVLADDNFTTIVRAVKEGRSLFANLKKAVRYYLACKVALILSTLLPVLLAVPVPFAPVQIILMELFMDVAASSTFVAEPTEEDLMIRPPRDPKQPFMDRRMVTSIFMSASGLFGAVSVAYLVTWYSGVGMVSAQTVAFVTWMIGHVLLALNLRSEREPLIRLGLFSNRLMLVWGLATIIFVLLITSVPWVQSVFKTTGLSAGQWGLALGAALVGTCWLELRKLFLYRRV